MYKRQITAVAGWLTPTHFYLEKHAVIYAAILACYSRRVPPDLATVADGLRRDAQLEDVGGISFLGELAGSVPTAVHIEYYARTVERTAVGRALIETGGQIAALGFDDGRAIEERLEDAGQLVYQLSAKRQIGQDFLHIGAVASEYFDAISGSDEADGGLLGVGTGCFNPPGGSGSLGTPPAPPRRWPPLQFQSAGRIREPWNRQAQHATHKLN